MSTRRKIPIEAPAKLPENAMETTETERAGLEPTAAAYPYAQLRALRGKVQFWRTSEELKLDRELPAETD